MTDYKTLRVPEDAWQEAKAQKEENDRTWGEQIVRGGDVDNSTTSTESKSISDAKREIIGRIDDLEARLPRKVKEELR